MTESNSRSLNQGFVLTRKLALAQDAPVDEEDLRQRLTPLPGMLDVSLKKARCLKLRYDASQIHIDGVIEQLQEVEGIRLKTGFWVDRRLGWYRFVDANAAHNARNTETHCCNRVPRR